MDTQKLKQLTGTTDLDKPLVTIAEFSVEASQSSRPIWSKPIPKFAMAALLLFPVILLAGTFLTGGGHLEQKQPILGQAGASPGAQPTQTAKQDTMEQEIARLKAKSALDGQAKMEKQLTKQPNSKPIKVVQQPKPQASTKAPPATNIAIQSTPPKLATASVARPEVIPIRASEPRPLPRATAPPMSKPDIMPPEESIDPQERWQQLVKLGSYGSIRPEAVQTPESMAKVEPQQTSEPQATLATWDRQEPAIEPPLLDMKPPALIAGTNAAAVLETPLVLDDGKTSERFTIALSEGIPDATGKIALPVNTRLTVQVNGISQTGRVQLSAVTATWNQDSQTQEITLPPGAVQIRGDQGQPLIAQQFEDKGRELAALDRGQFVLSAVRGAAGQLTQPNTRVQTGNGSTIVTQENPRPNILAGAIQGGADTLLTTIAERNKRAAEEIQKRPPIRYIPAGTAVQVFVNRSIQLPI
jgi:Bacterial conjugation TrbI-like protein